MVLADAAIAPRPTPSSTCSIRSSVVGRARIVAAGCSPGQRERDDASPLRRPHGVASGPTFPYCSRFMAYASRVMRGSIIDHARSRSAQNAVGHSTSRRFAQADQIAIDERHLTRISDALDELATINCSRKSSTSSSSAGFSFAEIAAMRHISERSRSACGKGRIYRIARSARICRPDLCR